MDEAHNAEGGGSRRSFGGMFSGILSKQLSMDTDTSDRTRKSNAFGGKVKPGYGAKHLLARTSSSSGAGDVNPTPESPLAASLVTSSPSAEWVAAGQDAAVNQSWPGGTPQLQSTPTRGLSVTVFSKLLSKKKFRGTNSPAGNRSPSLGTSSRDSESPRSQSAEHLICSTGTGAISATPPYKQHSQEGFGSVYSTPMGPGGLQSPVTAYPDLYGGETVDLHQVMRQDLPEVFTPGFNELLGDASGRPCDPKPVPDSNMEEPTIMLVSGAQLAQAGQLYDASSMLFATQPTDSSTEADVLSSPAHGTYSPKDGQPHVDVPSAEMADADSSHFEGEKEGSSVCVEDVQLDLASAEVAASRNELQAEQQDIVPQSETVQCADATLSCTADATTLTSTAEPIVADECDESASDTTCAEAQRAADLHLVQLLPASESSTEKLAQPGASEQQQTADAPAAWPELEPSVVEVPAGIVPSEHREAVAAVAVEEAACTAVDQQLCEASFTAAAEPDSKACEADFDVSQAQTVVSIADSSCTTVRGPHSDDQATALNAMQSSLVDPASSPVTAAAPTPGEMPTATDKVNDVPEGLVTFASALDTDTASESQQAVELPQAEQTALLAEQQQQHVAASMDSDDSTSRSVLPVAPQMHAADGSPEGSQFAAEKAIPAADTTQDAHGCHSQVQDSAVQPTCVAQAVHSSAVSEVAVLPSLSSAESSGQISDTDEAVALPIPGDDDIADSDEPGSPVTSLAAYTAHPTPLSSHSPVQQPAVPSLLKSSSGPKSRQSPTPLVRESMPLFLADPSKAMGSPLSLEEEGLDDQDMQQIIGRSAQQMTASQRTSLLTRGGPQRVAVGSLSGNCFGSLEPVAEASFNSAESPSSERSPSLSGSDAGATSSRPVDFNQEMSPMQPRRLSKSSQGTPAAAQLANCSSPILGGTPGSVYSTPTLAFNNGSVTGQQGLDTPNSGLTNVSVGSAIRQVTPPVAGRLDLSSAMHDLPEPSPTLVLMPGAPGLNDTPVALQAQSGDGTTPSLLDARAASPSAVYATRFMATPFRGALAALPMDAALAAPLIDSSPFQLSDCGMDTVCLADEAQRVAANLAIAASGFAATPVRTTAVNIPQATASPASAASQGRAAATAGSPTEELRDLHVVMLTKQLADVQKKMKDLEGENLRLKEQVEIYEFEKTELNSQEEMEKQARQYAEEQLQDMRVEMQKLLQTNSAQAQQMVSMQQEFQEKQLEAQTRFDSLKQDHAQLTNTIAQLQDERNQVLDKLNLVDMQVTALKSSNADLSAAVEAEQQRCAELEAALAARDRDLAEAGRCSIESQARLEKMMEQLIAANTAKEHARQKAADEAAKLQQVLNERQQLLAERQAVVTERDKYVALKHKYSQKSNTLKEVEQKLQAKEAENQELMAMCDQLLQQQEARRQ